MAGIIQTYKHKETCVFPEGADTSTETNDKHHSTTDDEDEGRVKGHRGYLANVGEHVFFCPGPKPYCTNPCTNKL